MRSHIQAEADTRVRRLMPYVLGAAYLLTLGLRPLVAPDEVRYAEIAREMLDRGDWIVPHFLGLRYFEKPVLGYWLNALSELVLGRTNFAVRFPSALCALLTAALVGLHGVRLTRERAVGRAAVCVYLSVLFVFIIGTTSVLDNLLALCTTAAMVAYDTALRASRPHERLLWHALFGVCCGLGFLAKGGVALAAPVVTIVPYMLWRGRWRELLVGGCVASAAAVLVLLPWAIAIAHREPDFWRYFIVEEHLRRFAGGDAQHAQPFWFFLPVLIAGLMPWTFALPGVLRSLWQGATELRREDVVYLLLWWVMPFLFFSIARGKLATYILPCFAPLAILLALGLTPRSGTSDRSPRLRAAAWSNMTFGMLLSLVVLGATLGWGVKAPVFAPGEWVQPTVVITALLWWIASAVMVLTRPDRPAWPAFASMPLALMLALPFVHPVSGGAGLMPSEFVEANTGGLSRDTVVVSNSVALASALAWTLERDGVTLLETSGELEYGLGYPDAAGRFVAAADFPDWLEHMRAEHDVALFIDRDWVGTLPRADSVVGQGPITFLLYLRRS